MNTLEFINLLEINTDADGMARHGDNSLIFFTNQAQNLLLNQASEQNVVFGNDGRLPAFDTQNNIFRYPAPDNIRHIAGILVEIGTSGSILDSIRITDYGLNRTDTRSVERVDIGAINYARIPHVRSFDAGDSTNAYIIFTENPGDSEEVYRWWGYLKPTNLMSDSVPLSIKPPYDMKYLLPATIKLIQGYKDGNLMQAILDIELLTLKLNKELNKGEQGQDLEAIDRGF